MCVCVCERVLYHAEFKSTIGGLLLKLLLGFMQSPSLEKCAWLCSGQFLPKLSSSVIQTEHIYSIAQHILVVHSDLALDR